MVEPFTKTFSFIISNSPFVIALILLLLTQVQSTNDYLQILGYVPTQTYKTTTEKPSVAKVWWSIPEFSFGQLKSPNFSHHGKDLEITWFIYIDRIYNQFQAGIEKFPNKDSRSASSWSYELALTFQNCRGDTISKEVIMWRKCDDTYENRRSSSHCDSPRTGPITDFKGFEKASPVVIHAELSIYDLEQPRHHHQYFTDPTSLMTDLFAKDRIFLDIATFTLMIQISIYIILLAGRASVLKA